MIRSRTVASRDCFAQQRLGFERSIPQGSSAVGCNESSFMFSAEVKRPEYTSLSTLVLQTVQAHDTCSQDCSGDENVFFWCANAPDRTNSAFTVNASSVFCYANRLAPPSRIRGSDTSRLWSPHARFPASPRPLATRRDRFRRPLAGTGAGRAQGRGGRHPAHGSVRPCSHRLLT